MIPQIVSIDTAGLHNTDPNTLTRLNMDGVYKDLSTIIIVPGFGQMPTKCVAAWMSLMTPPNGKVIRLWPMNMEVGEAFSQTVEACINHPDLQNFKYILTMEHDNAPPPDGLVKILSKLEKHKEYAAIGGLYFTKGYGGQPQIWGDPTQETPNYRPQLPVDGQLVECCGTGMGFTVFRLDMFKDTNLRRPWFKTVCSATEGSGTQDLYFWGDARKHGYRCAIDCDVKVGHYDLEGKFGPPDTMW